MSAAGGVGTTTILATLARIYTLRGEDVLLVEGRPNSILPLYFGSPHVLNGACTLRFGNQNHEGLVHMLSARTPGTNQEEQLRGALESLLPLVSRVLFDASSAMPSDLVPEAECLVTLIPDMRCFMRATRFLAEHSHGPRFHFLLNQFDESLALHRELRGSLAAVLGPALLPFVIRNSTDIPLYLSDGATVVDCAPHGEVAGDFARLAQWVTECGQKRSQTGSAVAVG